MAQRARDQGTEENRVVALSRELTLSEGRLAATRFELVEIKELNRRWEMSIGSIQAMNATLGKIINRQNGEILELKSQINARQEETDRLRAELASCTEPVQPGGEGESEPGKSSPRKKSLRERLGGGFSK